MNRIAIDRESLLADVPGDASLADVETALASAGLTLRLTAAAPGDERVAEWLARGAPGARDPWSDPADHLVAGLDAVLTNGEALSVRPGPRRATGPDLVALFVGAGGRFGAITRVYLRVHEKGARLPEVHPFVHPRSPELSSGERDLLDAIARELGASS